MGETTICEGCGAENDESGEACGNCGMPLDLTEFSLDGVADEDTQRAAEVICELFEGIKQRARGTTGQVTARDEALLFDTVQDIAAALDDEQRKMLVWRLEALRYRLKGTAQRAARAALQGVIDSVHGGAFDPGCRTPVKIEVRFDPRPRQGLVQIEMQVERTRPLPEVHLEIRPPSAGGAVQFDAVRRKLALRERRSASVLFQGIVKEPGPVRLPVQLRVRCPSRRDGRGCTCCFGADLHWEIGRDDGQTLVINQQTVRFSAPSDTNYVRPEFNPVTEVKGRSDRAGGTVSFPLTLFVDPDRIHDQVRVQSPAPRGQTGTTVAVEAAHFLVESGRHRSLLFVLLGREPSLGRSHHNHIVTRYGALNSDESHWGFVSRRQARLVWRNDIGKCELVDEGSANGTGVRRVRRYIEVRDRAELLRPHDTMHIPFRDGMVERPYAIKVRERHHHTADADATRTSCVVLVPERDVHSAFVHQPPYTYVWMPDPAHEVTVGEDTVAAVRLPGLGRDVAFRLIRDEYGHLLVAPASGTAMQLDREGDDPRPRALQPHTRYYLNEGDVLQCGGAQLTYCAHQTAGDDRASLADYYRGEGGRPFDPPREFRSLLLPLMVRAE